MVLLTRLTRFDPFDPTNPHPDAPHADQASLDQLFHGVLEGTQMSATANRRCGTCAHWRGKTKNLAVSWGAPLPCNTSVNETCADWKMKEADTK